MVSSHSQICCILLHIYSRYLIIQSDLFGSFEEKCHGQGQRLYFVDFSVDSENDLNTKCCLQLRSSASWQSIPSKSKTSFCSLCPYQVRYIYDHLWSVFLIGYFLIDNSSISLLPPFLLGSVFFHSFFLTSCGTYSWKIISIEEEIHDKANQCHI